MALKWNSLSCEVYDKRESGSDNSFDSRPCAAPAGNDYSAVDLGEHQNGKDQNNGEYLGHKRQPI